jgi:hypothetical protein
MHPSWRQYHYHTTLHRFSNSTFSQISMTTSLTRPTHIGGKPSQPSGSAFPMTTTLQTFASGNDDYKIYHHHHRLPSPPKTASHNLYLLLVVMAMVPLLMGDRSVCPIIICDDDGILHASAFASYLPPTLLYSRGQHLVNSMIGIRSP